MLPRGRQAHVDQARRQGRRDRQRLVDGGDDRRPAGLQSAYAATKGAVDSFTKGFAREVGGRGHPGQFDPAGHGADRDDREAGSQEPAFRARIEASIPDAPRRARADEIAETILWLLSDEASFITGAMVDAAGGGYII